MYLSLWCIFVCSIGFGASTTYSMAIAFRIGLGLLNGVVVIAKTMVSEICTDPAHETRGMGVITISWFGSMLVAPGMGGLLYGKGVFGSEKDYPQLLPNIVCGVVALIGIFCTFFFLPETCERRQGLSCFSRASNPSKSTRRSGVEMTRLDSESQTNMLIDKHKQSSLDEEGIDKAEKRPVNDGDDEKRPLKAGASESDAIQEEEGGASILYNRKAWQYLFLYFATSLCSIAFDETFNLWTIATKEKGGLGWDAQQVGMCLTCAAVGVVCLTLTVTTKLTDNLGADRAFVMSSLMVCCTYSLMPWVPVFFTGSKARFYSVVVLLLISKSCGSASFTVLSLLVNRSVAKHLRGRMNGLSMCVGSLAKTFGPAISAPAFAWTISTLRTPWPVFVGCGASVAFASVFYWGLSTEFKFCLRAKPAPDAENS
eukprot:c17420_g1_i2.p1 GENE.c17420_g1_i2~~c17420_g1_i2.p1  ORF type:complete len:427 (+),score=83.26 c17420_g1_i2:340-1620(+)